MPTCHICGTKTRQRNRCKSCANRNRKIHNYCPDCGKEILKGSKRCKSCAYKISRRGEKNPMWKGESIGYSALHLRMRNIVEKPNKCVKCNDTVPYDLANKSGKYKFIKTDWEWLCRRCHMESDGRLYNLNCSGGEING